MSAETKVATKVRAVVDAKVEAEFDLSWADKLAYHNGRYVEMTLAERGEMLARKCREFNDFVRDHRSQDPVSLSVVLVEQDQCSECGDAWEVDEDEGGKFCASCGTRVSA